MALGLGFSFGFGRLKGVPSTTIYAPSIEWDGDETDSRPDFDVIFWRGAGAPFDTAVGDVLRIRNITLGSTYLTHTFTSDDIAGTPFTVSGVTPLANGDYDFDARIERGAHVSAWSASDSVTVNAVAVSAGIGWPWLWIPNSGSSNAGQPTGPWLWLLQG